MSTDTLELVNLDELLNNEPGCEMKHMTTACTVHVTHRATACTNQVNICDTAAQRVRDCMERGDFCGGCMNFAADCWKVIPI